MRLWQLFITIEEKIFIKKIKEVAKNWWVSNKKSKEWKGYFKVKLNSKKKIYRMICLGLLINLFWNSLNFFFIKNLIKFIVYFCLRCGGVGFFLLMTQYAFYFINHFN